MTTKPLTPKMKLLTAFWVVGFALTAAFTTSADAPTNLPATNPPSEPRVETIVCVRHGEKPHGGLGQLSCRGLNRALALPTVLLGKFGPPQYIFAPNPTQKVDGQGEYYYIRPLMTIEPTAIRCGLPVNTQFGFKEIDGLALELQKPEYGNALIFVAWEHGLLDDFVKAEVKAYGGDPQQVPAWPSNDFDSIFILKITRTNQQATVTFTTDHEQLNNLPDNCP